MQDGSGAYSIVRMGLRGGWSLPPTRSSTGPRPCSGPGQRSQPIFGPPANTLAVVSAYGDDGRIRSRRRATAAAPSTGARDRYDDQAGKDDQVAGADIRGHQHRATGRRQSIPGSRRVHTAGGDTRKDESDGHAYSRANPVPVEHRGRRHILRRARSEGHWQ